MVKEYFTRKYLLNTVFPHSISLLFATRDLTLCIASLTVSVRVLCISIQTKVDFCDLDELRVNIESQPGPRFML